MTQIRPLKFLALLKWLDGRDLLPLLPPIWIEIIGEVFDFQPDGLLKFPACPHDDGQEEFKKSHGDAW